MARDVVAHVEHRHKNLARSKLSTTEGLPKVVSIAFCEQTQTHQTPAPPGSILPAACTHRHLLCAILFIASPPRATFFVPRLALTTPLNRLDLPNSDFNTLLPPPK